MSASLASEQVVISQDGPIVTIRLNRPGKLNALTPAMHEALQLAFDAFAADQGQRVAILAATGRAFCAGSDLKAAAERLARGEGAYVLPAGGYGGLASRFNLEKPVIAAVNGDALGGGFELALACDLIVAAEGARFSLPETKSGVVAIGGGPHRLARAIGPKRAMDIVLTGRWVSAREAFDMGLVSRIAPDDALEATCLAVAQEILRCAPKATAASKQLVQSTLDQPSLAAAIGDQDSLPAMQRWRVSTEPRDGAEAFAAKRKPDWTPQ